ncbi:CocE/NonD family hydrolase, partial [Ferruginibacter sp.]|uniref:CocE/NonD family hydrolase n=1 Tax=Ferruginibacter sp. TaxID=1940288 RepID=UPI0019C04938
HLGNINFESNTSLYYQDLEVPFFNYYMKGTGSDTLSKATIFFSGENKWRRFTAWPVSNAVTTPVYLQQNGKLSFTPASGRQLSFDSYISDPAKPVPYAEKVHAERTREYMDDDQRFAARRTDVLTYDTGILNGDMTVAGPVVADLMVSLSNTDADFIVKLIDVFPDDAPVNLVTNYPMGGYQMLVRAEVMRGKFRNSFEKPMPFIPNRPTTVKYTMPDVAHTFKKGHRLMIQIQSTWFPLTDRNPQKFTDNINKATNADFVKETIKVYHNSSKIILPVIK